MPATLNQAPVANEPVSRRTELAVSGMTCQNCVRHAREALEKVPGVRSVTVSLPDERASVQWGPESALDTGALLQSLKEAGYAARILQSNGKTHDDNDQCHSAAWELNLWI